VSNAVSILRSNEFQLKPSEGTQSETEYAKDYYLSCARSLKNRYFNQGISSLSVLFVLDRNKLQSKYKIRSVNYWASELPEADEMEDRVLSRKPEIKNATSYVREIHLQASEKFLKQNPEKTKHLYDLHKLCIKNKVPLYVYRDNKSMGLLDKRKAVKLTFKEDGKNLTIDFPKSRAIPFTVTIPTTEKEKNDLEYEQYKRKRNALSHRRNQIFRWLELYFNPVTRKDKLSEDAKRALKGLGYFDGINTFNADLHNAKSYPVDDATKNRKALQKLVDIMKKENMTAESFYKMLEEKWRQA